TPMPPGASSARHLTAGRLRTIQLDRQEGGQQPRRIEDALSDQLINISSKKWIFPAKHQYKPLNTSKFKDLMSIISYTKARQSRALHQKGRNGDIKHGNMCDSANLSPEYTQSRHRRGSANRRTWWAVKHWCNW
ncbi:hypothetical protein, partial [Burkholderia sp. BCC1977]|uniref:hypothetical protein n=1 Tax=Burkholderia sp. BCC1977 TaxID=2817440 RepID=UPI002ABDC9DD